jgi:TRAP-type C4-dicarboxylate transport system permease small subunit
MASNGKGNGKKAGGAPGEAARSEGSATNGKGKESTLAEAAAAEEKAERAAGEAPPAHAEEAEAEQKAESAPPAKAAPKPEAIPEKKEPEGAAWANPIAHFEQRWTRLEARLLTFVLVWQILALVAWVFLNGLSETVGHAAGAVFRAIGLASIVGTTVWLRQKALPEEKRRRQTLWAIGVSLATVVLWSAFVQATMPPEAVPKLPEKRIELPIYVIQYAWWATVRVIRETGPLHALAVPLAAGDRAMWGYFDNIKGWLQEGSTLTLLGGLRGLGTRLTLWLALLGGSLATASGKHIHVDVVFRFLPRKMRVPVTILNYCAAAAVCFAAVWGFFDHIAIESYGSKADDRAGAKVENAIHHIGNHAFFTRKQIGLDLRSLPRVLSGKRYDSWMSAAAWNEWVDDAGFESRWEPEKVKNLRVPLEANTHPPFVVSPDGESTRGALAHTLGLVFPFGLLAIALRFLLRAVLTLSGHYSADPDDAHKEEIGSHTAEEGGV